MGPKGNKNERKAALLELRDRVLRERFGGAPARSPAKIRGQSSPTGGNHTPPASGEQNRSRSITARTPEAAIPGGNAGGSPRGKRTRGQVVLDEIGEEFARLRESGGRSEAWAALQSKLMRNLGTVVPDAASLEQCISLSLKIEDFRKSEQAHSKAPGDVLSEWLQSGDGDAA